MSGFKNFILRGNLVELAVAFVMAGAFALVVNATVDLILGVVGKIGGQPNFTGWPRASFPSAPGSRPSWRS
jgi:large conductance mechanosensitive channel